MIWGAGILGRRDTKGGYEDHSRHDYALGASDTYPRQVYPGRCRQSRRPYGPAAKKGDDIGFGAVVIESAGNIAAD